MATLLLGAVGGVLGGPVGAAVGAVLGQAVDREVLLKPKGRQGPRLTELAVQTSSYGTQLPRLFGTMRVAGCVIWSTDLIESHSKSSAGKGQPKVTTYSYAASFAVALSARQIVSVGRIWADGKLLRGAGGDFKSSVGAFRLHIGGEDQAPDPLIASAEGSGLAPAHRGIAYAVLEQLQLADFGNRIPSLTFEVVADADAPGVGAIAAAVGAGAIDGAAVAMPMGGFSAYGDSARGVLEALAEASGAWWAPAGDGLAMRDAGSATSAMVSDAGTTADGAGGAVATRAVAALDGVAKTLTLSHYDPARDYQIGVQRARRPGAGDRAERVELAAAVDAATARSFAEAMLLRAEAARVRRTLATTLAALAVAPGDVVTIAGEAGSWRVADTALEAMVVKLGLVPLHPAPIAAQVASAGRVAAAADLAAGTTLLHAFETAPLDDAVLSAPRLTIVAAGTQPGWRRAALLLSTDDGASWQEAGGTAAPAVIGTVATAPGAASTALRDDRTVFEVELGHAGMALHDADAAALDAGANLALVGDELLQFGSAVPIGATRWRLGQLLRGRRGTEAAVGGAVGGARFVLLEHAGATTLDLPLTALGQRVRVMASGVGDAVPVETSAVIGGASVLPPSPVLLRAASGGGGDATVTWVRRSRAGWRWIDGADVPLAEEGEHYRVTVRAGSGDERTLETVLPLVVVTAVERSGGPALVTVRQLGLYGESPAATIGVAAI